MLSLFIALLYGLLSFWPWIEYQSLLSEAIEQTRLHAAALACTLAIGLWLAKRQIAAALILLGVAGNLLWVWSAYAPLWSPSLSTISPTPPFRIMSFNAHIKNRDTRSITEAVTRSNADLVLIIEANEQLQSELVHALSASHPYHTRNQNNRKSQLIALSKHRFIETENHLRVGPQGQQVLFVPLIFNGEQINIYGLHTLSPISRDLSAGKRIATRHRQINQLIGHIASDNGASPFIIAGDLNSAPWHPSVRAMEAVLNVRNSDHPPALNLTWPTWLPLPFAIPIDHIYHSQTLCSLKSHTIEIPGSDHRAIYADLTTCPAN